MATSRADIRVEVKNGIDNGTRFACQYYFGHRNDVNAILSLPDQADCNATS